MAEKSCFHCKSIEICRTFNQVRYEGSDAAIKLVVDGSHAYMAVIEGIRKTLAENCKYYDIRT